MKSINWGIIGLGRIAHKFMQDILITEGHEIFMVGSRNQEKAKQAAEQYKIQHYGDYEAVMKHENIDIIYVATPHHRHKELAIAAMLSNKHVLCEKPMGVNTKDVEEMTAIAKQQKVFLMEGLWSRFNPTIQQVIKSIAAGVIGEVNYMNVDFTFTAGPGRSARLDHMELAGGALLDVGIYPAFLSYLILGLPNTIKASAQFFPTGADKQVAFIFNYDHAISNLMAGFISSSDSIAHICGTKGRIDIHPRWHESEGFTLTSADGLESFHFPKRGNGFVQEIIECGTCIRNNQIESKFWSHKNSLDLIKVLDRVRAEIGLLYPFE